MIPPPHKEGELLSSWKEIAARLGRTIRTVQRWERTEGLPVHRHVHDKRDSVYAYMSELDAWWQARSAPLEHVEPEPDEPVRATRGPARGEFRPMRIRRWLTGGGLITAVLAAGIWQFRPYNPPPFGPRDWVLIADFENQTGDPVFDRTLGTAFAAGFQQSAHANILPATRIEAALRRMGRSKVDRLDEPLAREVCIRENVSRLIAGSIAAEGSGYLLVVRLIDPASGRTVQPLMEHPNRKEDVLHALGSLATKLRGWLGESAATIRRTGRPLPELTTPSLEALRLYAEGRSLWQMGRQGQALNLLNAALTHDPDFGMAHASLGNAYFQPAYFDPDRARRHYRRALEHAARLTDRERLYIEATFQGNLGHWQESVDLFLVYLKAYPDDAAARYRLGAVLFDSGRHREALAQLLETIRINPAEARAHSKLGAVYHALGERRLALASYARAIGLQPEWVAAPEFYHDYGFALAANGDLTKARELFSIAANSPAGQTGGIVSLALLALYEGRYGEAETRLREAALSSEAAQNRGETARIRLLLSVVMEGREQRRAQLLELDRASRALEAGGAADIRLCARLGAAHARAGEIRRAERILRALEKRLDRQSPGESSEFHRAAGEIAVAKGDTGRGLELLRLADRQASAAPTIESLAHALRLAGDLDGAISSYNRLIAVAWQALGGESQQAWAAAHIQLAEAFLSRGERRLAAAAIGPLARLWSGADASVALVDRMRRIQAKLKNGE